MRLGVASLLASLPLKASTFAEGGAGPFPPTGCPAVRAGWGSLLQGLGLAGPFRSS